eukprot:1156215-Pelagomonas_calceolata.AAC.12
MQFIQSHSLHIWRVRPGACCATWGVMDVMCCYRRGAMTPKLGDPTGMAAASKSEALPAGLTAPELGSPGLELYIGLCAAQRETCWEQQTTCSFCMACGFEAALLASSRAGPTTRTQKSNVMNFMDTTCHRVTC